MVLADSVRISRVPTYSGYQLYNVYLHVQDFHLLWYDFPDIFHFIIMLISPVLQPRQRRNVIGLGCSPFDRHYLGNHYLFYFPPGTKMFQFSGFAPRIATGTRPSAWWVAPFGNQRIYRIFAPPRRLSQLVTSFFASESQGIHHALLFTFLSNQILLTLIANMSKNFIGCPFAAKAASPLKGS